MFPTPEQELESKIREECFQEQIKVITEISKDIDKRMKCLFWILNKHFSIKLLTAVIKDTHKMRINNKEFLDKEKEKNVTKLVKLFFKSP